jgi:hypothetical protein
MDWLIGVATAVGGSILMLFLAELAGEALGGALRPLKHLYSPPHGVYTLAGTWLTAAALVVLAVMRAEWSLGLRSAITVLPIMAALFASFIYRDQRRRVYGLPEVVTIVPARFHWRGRVVLGSLTILAVGTAWVSVWANGWDAWLVVLGSVVAAGVTGVAAITGRMPDVAVVLIGARRETSRDNRAR